MKGLLLKDYYMILKYCRSLIVIDAIFLIISCFGRNNTFFIIYPTLIAGMLPVTLIAYDEREKWNIYTETLPYTRAQVVFSKYIIGLIFELAVFIISAVIQALRMFNFGYFSLGEYLSFILTILVIGLVAPSILLPFIFRFGAEKGRIAYYLVIGAFCAAGAILAGSEFQLTKYLSSDLIIILLTIAAILIFICSCGLSVVFYKKRDLY